MKRYRVSEVRLHLPKVDMAWLRYKARIGMIAHVWTDLTPQEWHELWKDEQEAFDRWTDNEPPR